MRNKQWLFGKGVLGMILGLALASHASGQPAPPVPAPVPTVWDKLGVTGAGKALQSHLLNPLGNHPGMEKKPLLKPITDPTNFDPKMPKAIQAAAAIKQQEDLAPQKIKAIKYLATQGCGCYQKTVDVRGALLEALDDCTEEVRLAAAQALCEVAGNPCNQCDGTCCGAETMNKLQEHASGKNANGCFKEPSAEVRQAAQAALDACRRKLPPGAAEVAPVPNTIPVEGPKPILPSPGEHPLGVHEEPAPVTPGPHVAPPPAPQPLPNPSGELNKPLEVPAEPPRSSYVPRPTLPQVLAARLGVSSVTRQNIRQSPPGYQVAAEPNRPQEVTMPAPQSMPVTQLMPVYQPMPESQPITESQPMPAPQAMPAEMPVPQPMPVAQPIAASPWQQPMELAAAPLPPPVAVLAPQPITSYQPESLQPVQQPLAIPTAAPAKPVTVPAVQSERSYVAIVDIKPVTYEARSTRRVQPAADTQASEQGKVTLRLIVPGEK
jgi:hypothetical protein